MPGSGGDWSTPKRSSKSKKKLRHCWVSRWRRQTATTSHDGCSCCPGVESHQASKGNPDSQQTLAKTIACRLRPLQCRIPALTRRRSLDAREECWHIYYG